MLAGGLLWLRTGFTLIDVAEFYAGWLLTLAPRGLRWLTDDLLWLVMFSDLKVPRTWYIVWAYW